MKRTLIAAALVAGTIIGGPALAEADRYEPPAPSWTQKPCKSEDSVNCFWDARRAGNKVGKSYIVRKFPGRNGTICVMYVNKKYAKKHDYCS